MVVRVVEVDDVDAIETQTFEALGQRPPDPVAGEVPDAPVRGGHGVAVVVESFDPRQRLQEPPHLGRDEEVAAGPGP